MKQILIHGLLLLHSVASTSDFSTNCELNQKSHLLDCSDMDSFPEGSFDEIEVINFSKNNLTTLKPYVFYEHGLYNIRTAILRSSNIGYINPNAFKLMSSLTHLDLYGNNLTSLHKNAFSGLGSLRQLHLGSNNLSHIDSEMLKPLRALETLDLTDNSITKLDRNFLSHNFVSQLDLSNNPLELGEEGSIISSSFLTELNMQACGLRTLPKEAFSQILQLEVLDLSRNKLEVIQNDLFVHLAMLKYMDISFNVITVITTNMFHIPSNMEALYCNGNPAKTNCTHLLAVMHGSHNDTEVKYKQQVVSASATHEGDLPKRSISINTSVQENDKLKEESQSLSWNMFYVLTGATITSAVLLVVLVIRICYVVCRYKKPEEHIYTEIETV